MALNASQAAVTAVVVGAVVIGGVAAGMTGMFGPTEGVNGANSVNASTGTGLEVTSVDAGEAVKSGEPLQVSMTVRNPGSEAVTRRLAILADRGGGEAVVAGREVTVSPDRSQTVSLTVPASEIRSDAFRFGVVIGASDERVSVRKTVEVLAPPDWSLTTVSESATVLTRENGSVTLSIGNDGDYRGSEAVVRWLDRNGDGAVQPNESVVTTTASVAASETDGLTVTLPTAGLSSGTYDYRVTVGEAEIDGTLVVQQRPTFVLTSVEAATDVVRGNRSNVSLAVKNKGDVAGTDAVRFEGPGSEQVANRTVELGANETTTLNFTTETTSLDRGNYTRVVVTDDDNATVPLRVRESDFQVVEVQDGPTFVRGEPMEFVATIVNAGDANATKTVELRIDFDEGDRPRRHGITKQVQLAAGERKSVEFRLEEYTGEDDPFDRYYSLPTGAAVYGIYTPDDSGTSVFVLEADPGSSGGERPSSVDSTPGKASKDEITQAKYGLFYEDLSGETRRQVDELYVRQPFTDNRSVVEVLTREQIARRYYELDVKRGDEFDFSAIDVEVQQQIEADFDAQFGTQTGDRIESWDELAQAAYGAAYEDLTDDQQATIRQRYREQFD